SPVKPVSVGPTWERDGQGKFVRPRWSLGWHIAQWAFTYLRHEDGSPWEYTEEQLRFLVHWYAIDRRGRFVYRDAVLQRMKGWGKDPVGATFCAAEFVGPCRYAGEFGSFEFGSRYPVIASDQPVGKPHPQAWVQTAAVSITQTKNTMTLFPSLFSEDAINECQIDLGKEIIYAHRGSQRIEAVTSSPRTLEGARSTFVLRNETHHWLSNNEGHEMDRVIARNLAKSKDGAARALSITNAYEPGEDSVAERARETWEKVNAGQAIDTSFLYDSLEAPPQAKLTADEAPDVIEGVKGDSHWLDTERIVQEILDLRNPASQSRRFYYNQIVAAEDAWVTKQEWDALKGDEVVAEGAQITLGFDGSKSDDDSALMGCRVSDGYTWTLGVWSPHKDTNEVDRELIDGTVRHALGKYDVVGFFSDLHPWESYVDSWAEEFGRALCVKASTKHPVAWDMRTRQRDFTIEGAERVHDEIREQVFWHDGNGAVAQHVLNARRRPNKFGISFGKEHRESARKIDALPALILARMARRAYLALPDSKKRRKPNRAKFFS
ncbi:MAG TPA: terminase, partial [Thermoleophilia bacterium]|nr:terminase [Thermoleophilia bacterium]